MKIAVITSSYPRFPGDGTAPFIKSIAENIAKLGHTVHVIAPYDPLVKSYDCTSPVNMHWVKYFWPNSLNLIGHGRSLKGDAKLASLSFLLIPFYLLFGTIKTLRVCKTHNIDVLQVNWVLPNGPIAYIVSKLLKIPYMLSLHGSDIYVARKNVIFTKIGSAIIREASSITACSTELKDAAIKLGAGDKVNLLPWGANPDDFSPASYSNDLRKKYLGDSEGSLVLAVGRLVYKKGFDVLISAWNIIVNKFPDAKLIIGGEGPLQPQLERQAKELGIDSSVIFIGRIDWRDMPKYLASADIFVLPSIKDKFGNMDGLPTVLLEAMSSGTACVASDIGGVPLVIRNWENGVLVCSNDVGALANAINRLLVDRRLRTSIGSMARDSIVNNFTWLNIARKISDSFINTIQERRFKSIPRRLGVVYRKSYIYRLLKEKEKLDTDYVLDVGCFDGSTIPLDNVKNFIAVDLDPKPLLLNVNYVRADGINLPFEKGKFNLVFALDVLEHVKDDRAFASQLIDSIAPGGRLILTTPSANILIYPKFLTNWVSHEWGHIFRIGYTRDQLHELFLNPDIQISINPWNASSYRRWYLLARLLLPLFPNVVNRWVINMADKDYFSQDGDQGFWIVEAIRDNDNNK